MSDVPRRQIDDLITLAEVEAEVRTVYVEGASDARLLEWFLYEVGLADRVQVYPIESVDVPASLVAKYGQHDGHRGRVVALALYLCETSPKTCVRLRCVADRDFGDFLGMPTACDCLDFTDYVAMEMYFFAAAPLRKFLAIVCNGFPYSADDVLRELTPVLEASFFLRLACASLSVGSGHVGVTRSCSTSGGVIQVDLDSYLERYLHVLPTHDLSKRVVAAVEEWKRRRNADSRQQIHGHDFVVMLEWYLRRYKSSLPFSNEEGLRRSLYACAELADLAEMPLFRRLVALAA